MTHNQALGKSRDFYNGKKAILTHAYTNRANEILEAGTPVTIEYRHQERRSCFNVKSDDGIYMYCVHYDYLELIQEPKK